MIIFYYDYFRKLDRQTDFPPRDIRLNGSFIIGQETDKVASGYQEQQSFCGYITMLK